MGGRKWAYLSLSSPLIVFLTLQTSGNQQGMTSVLKPHLCCLQWIHTICVCPLSSWPVVLFHLKMEDSGTGFSRSTGSELE
jgi:hypothetical protein